MLYKPLPTLYIENKGIYMGKHYSATFQNSLVFEGSFLHFVYYAYRSFVLKKKTA